MKALTLIAFGLAFAGSWKAEQGGPVATPDSPPSSRAPLSDSPEMALRQLGSLVPIGMPQKEAVWILQNQGFTVSIFHGFFGSENFPKYLYCDYRQIGVRRYRRWQVAVVIVNGRIADYRVVVGS